MAPEPASTIKESDSGAELTAILKENSDVLFVESIAIAEMESSIPKSDVVKLNSPIESDMAQPR